MAKSSSFKTVPLNFVGGESKSRSGYFNSESCINLYVDLDETNSSRSTSSLLPWPGEKIFCENTSGGSRSPRGMIDHGGFLFLIIDQTLWEIDQYGNRINKGTIPGTARCSMVSNGSGDLVIRTGSASYYYNGSVAQITDVDLENGQSVAYLNNQFIFQGAGGRFMTSDVGNATSINALNLATAEFLGDDLRQIFVFREQLILAGEKTIEFWYNSTNVTNPPFERVNNATTNIGVASSFSMAKSDTYYYFLGNDKNVYRGTAYQPQNITTTNIASELRQCVTSDAIGFVVKLDGQNFYILVLPTSNKTYAVSEKTGLWFRLSSGTDEVPARHLADDYVYLFDKHLVVDYRNGNVLEWDFNTFTSNGDVIIRQRDTAPINSTKLGSPGNRLIMKKMEVMMETGVGNVDTANPKVMISASFDGGRSFTNEKWSEIGRASQPIKKVEFWQSSSFYDVMFRVRVSDPCFVGFHGGTIDIKLGGY